jgi:hypothetical protein
MYSSCQTSRDLVRVGILVVDLDVVELVTNQPTACIYLVHGHADAVRHLLAVGGDRTAERVDADDLDVAFGAGASTAS